MDFKVGQFYKTRDGRKAEILCVDLKGYQPVAIRIFNKDGDLLELCELNGKYNDDPDESEFDLIEPWTESKPRRLVWIYSDGTVRFSEDKEPYTPISINFGMSDSPTFKRAPWLDEPEEKK